MKESIDKKDMRSYFQSFKRQAKFKLKPQHIKKSRLKTQNHSLSEIKEDLNESFSYTIE